MGPRHPPPLYKRRRARQKRRRSRNQKLPKYPCCRPRGPLKEQKTPPRAGEGGRLMPKWGAFPQKRKHTFSGTYLSQYWGPGYFPGVFLPTWSRPHPPYSLLLPKPFAATAGECRAVCNKSLPAPARPRRITQRAHSSGQCTCFHQPRVPWALSPRVGGGGVASAKIGVPLFWFSHCVVTSHSYARAPAPSVRVWSMPSCCCAGGWRGHGWPAKQEN